MHVEWIDRVPPWLPHVDRVGWVGSDGTGALVIEPDFSAPTIRHPGIDYEDFDEIRPMLENYYAKQQSPDDILGDIFRNTATVTEDQSPWIRALRLTCYNCGDYGFKEMVTPSGYLCDACTTFVPYGTAERDECGHDVPGIWLEVDAACPKCELERKKGAQESLNG